MQDRPSLTEAESLYAQIRACRLCEAELPAGPRPVIQAHPEARILIVGQAPGRKVHETEVPFNDPSGDRLRDWMGISREVFYEARNIALLPMGFCYPGTGKSGDLPPRPKCAETWREPLLATLPNIQLTLLVGQYALDYHMPNNKGTVTQKVQAWREHWPHIVPTPHPSPRNNRWLRNNPWFEAEVIPALQERVSAILGNATT